jgi:hypothetical protein
VTPTLAASPLVHGHSLDTLCLAWAAASPWMPLAPYPGQAAASPWMLPGDPTGGNRTSLMQPTAHCCAVPPMAAPLLVNRRQKKWYGPNCFSLSLFVEGRFLQKSRTQTISHMSIALYILGCQTCDVSQLNLVRVTM